ncbi:hypothetical protein PVAP13_2NG273900 [Panicum virgatum]|uniref:Uncharacterized protein n=1 Tax=Panicum virgatum TaxID=38727 RepID=A0A8T0VEE3_PANVG|nr:hypothetical protein PVAP13_2NG273900 [Panicum virgatum]
MDPKRHGRRGVATGARCQLAARPRRPSPGAGQPGPGAMVAAGARSGGGGRIWAQNDAGRGGQPVELAASSPRGAPPLSWRAEDGARSGGGARIWARNDVGGGIWRAAVQHARAVHHGNASVVASGERRHSTGTRGWAEPTCAAGWPARLCARASAHGGQPARQRARASALGGGVTGLLAVAARLTPMVGPRGGGGGPGAEAAMAWLQ